MYTEKPNDFGLINSFYKHVILHIKLNNIMCKLPAFINYFCYEFLMSYPISPEARDAFLYVRGIVKKQIFFI